ncbi:MAG: exodeoxyribonuclease VII large subunit [Alphaproteobacteria bacterium]|nr:exodeoxyribonuclease VII large subunit [Alphaproteobacteria bacterium]
MNDTSFLPPQDKVFSVTDFSLLLKGVVEGAFSRIKIQGEVSGLKKASSGHIYFSLKDDDSVIDAVSWRGQNAGFANLLKDGQEIICTGKVTTYPARSHYQIIVESVELAGEGELLKLLEERKKKLAAEGLFAEERKKSIPFLPDVIGVITSPTGAVIRDIIHRLSDRFPRRVLLWGVPVQGEEAAAKVTEAINGFNLIPKEGLITKDGIIPRPNVLIVARGGGSIEDLWPFNEENVVRAAAASDIPLISAVGHETDTTLIDYASDLRAPTPTGAAEKAVPVRSELLSRTSMAKARMLDASARFLTEQQTKIKGLARGIPNLEDIVEQYIERLDDKSERLIGAARIYLKTSQERFNSTARLLESYSYTKILARGFALVMGKDGHTVSSSANANPGDSWQIHFADGQVPVTVTGENCAKSASEPKAPRKRKTSTYEDKQGNLPL